MFAPRLECPHCGAPAHVDCATWNEGLELKHGCPPRQCNCGARKECGDEHFATCPAAPRRRPEPQCAPRARCYTLRFVGVPAASCAYCAKAERIVALWERIRNVAQLG